MSSPPGLRFAPSVDRRGLDAAAVRAVLVASLNVLLGGAAAWRISTAETTYARAAARYPPGPVRVWGSDRFLQPDRATLLNAALSHHFAYDDTADVLLAHPGVVLAPALLSGCGPDGLAVDDYAAAFASGYECEVRLARVLNPGHYGRGFHATSTLGCIGAANAAAVLLGADDQQRVAATGIAASRSSGLRSAVGHDIRAWHAGFAAEQGLEAARLAMDGLRPSPDAIAGRFGFLEVFGTADTADGLAVEEPSDGVALNGSAVLNLKEYPGCGALAPVLSALRAALEELSVERESVVSVEATVNPFVLEVVSARWPDRPAEAGFSLSFALAVMLRSGRLRPWDFTEDALRDPHLRALAERIAITVDEVGPTKYESTVRLRTVDGRAVSVRRPGVGGRPATEYTVAEVVDRWAELWPDADRGAVGRAAEAFVEGPGPDLSGRVDALLDCLGTAP